MATRFFLKVLLNGIQVQPMELSKQRQRHLLRFIRVLDDLKTRKIPLVLAFLPNKTKESYKISLSVLALNCEKLENDSRQIFLTDYRKGFTAAVPDFLPEAQHLGCHFQYCLAVFIRFQKLHLATEYRQDQKIRKKNQ